MIKNVLILCLLVFGINNAQNLNSSDIRNLKKCSNELKLKYWEKNWSKINSQIKSKQLVLLGECNHGSKEIFYLKNNLIKYLKENHDFQVVLFESGLAEMISYYDNDKLPVSELKTAWQSHEFKELLSYVKKNDMEVAGFDILVTGKSFKNRIDSIKGINSDIELEFKTITTALQNIKKDNSENIKKALALIGVYFSIKERIQGHTKISKLTQRGIENRVSALKSLIKYQKDKDFKGKINRRDSLMASNINWLMKYIYANQKAIVYTHNIHDSKYNENLQMMGEILKLDWKQKMFSIGSFAQSGNYVDYTGKPKIISPIKTDNKFLDLKEVISNSPYEYSYLDTTNKSNNWMHKTILINDTFIDTKNSNFMLLSENFDGLIFLKKVSPPNFIIDDF